MVNDQYKLINGMIVKQTKEASSHNNIAGFLVMYDNNNSKFKAGDQLGLIVRKSGGWPKGGILGNEYDVEMRLLK